MKLQRPLGSNNPIRPWLIYNRDRSHEGTIPEAEISEEVKAAMHGDYKAYFSGHLEPDGCFAITHRVSDQPW